MNRSIYLTLRDDTYQRKTNTETNDRQGVHSCGFNSVQRKKYILNMKKTFAIQLNVI